MLIYDNNGSHTLKKKKKKKHKCIIEFFPKMVIQNKKLKYYKLGKNLVSSLSAIH